MQLKAIKFIGNLKKYDTEHSFDFTGMQPFVFAVSEDTKGAKLRDPCVVNGVLASPFPCFSIEYEANGCFRLNEQQILTSIVCRELEVGKYHFIACIDDDDNDLGAFGKEFFSHSKDYDFMLSLVDAMLTKLNTHAIGAISTNSKVKYKNNKNQKKLLQPTNIIYISEQSRETKQSKLPVRSGVKWDHSFPVMAHWRKLVNLESLGIDRTGARNVKGYTWIASHIRGDGELVTKIRKVS